MQVKGLAPVLLPFAPMSRGDTRARTTADRPQGERLPDVHDEAIARATQGFAQARESEPVPTVLVVDDELGPRESLRIILSPEHRVIPVEGGSAALEVLRSEAVDLVTVDLNMPGMKGQELVRTLRAGFPDVAVIVITGNASVESAVLGIRQGVADYLTKPFDVVQVQGAVARALAERDSRRRLVHFLEEVGNVLGHDRDSDAMLGALRSDEALQQRLREIVAEPALSGARAQAAGPNVDAVAVLEVLAEAIEQRDIFMRGHARRVAYYGALIAHRLCLDPDECETVRIAAFMHDIGKVGVATDVIHSRERLDVQQRRQIEAHSGIGERLVAPLGFSAEIASAIRHHHEHWDGGGYPDGLAGEDIPLAARIIAIADAFDAITCSRPYQAARTEMDAVRELRKESGRQFDASLAAHFADLVESSGALLDGLDNGAADDAAPPPTTTEKTS